MSYCSLLALYVIICIIIILDIQLLLMLYIILFYSCVHTNTCILLIVFYIQRYNSQVQAGNSLCNYRGGLDMYMFCWPCIKSSKSCLCLYWWGCSLCVLLPPALGGGGELYKTHLLQLYSSASSTSAVTHWKFKVWPCTLWLMIFSLTLY